MNASLTVKDLGEQELLKKLQTFCPANVVGDDGAVLAIAPGQLLVVTTDLLVDGVHWSDRTMSAVDVGWRAVAANLSDLAAMGASPIGITVGLSLPPQLPIRWLDELYRGMDECLKSFGGSIIGGDICRSSVTNVSITALGQVFPNRTINRNSAQRDDAIVVTGSHGLSRAGLELLLNPQLGEALTESERAQLIKAHRRPRPRLDVIPLIWESLDYPSVAGMDSSDGLADAVVQICRASEVGAEIEFNSLPISPILLKMTDFDTALDWLLYGGEDYELVIFLSQKAADALVKKLEGAAIIGRVTNSSEVVLTDKSGQYPTRKLGLEQGFKHF